MHVLRQNRGAKEKDNERANERKKKLEPIPFWHVRVNSSKSGSSGTDSLIFKCSLDTISSRVTMICMCVCVYLRF